MNTITHILPWIELVLSIVLVVLVLVARSADGIDGGALGGTSANMTYFARRGSERFFFVSTVVVAVLFAGCAVIALVA